MNNQKLTCNKARELNIIDVLKKLGSSPAKDTDNDAWFLSPFREEKKASFKVSKKLNSWFDHGLGKGGNVIDLIVQLKGYSVKETLDFLDGNINSFSFHQQTNLTSNNADKNYQITKVKNLENQALLDYLNSRKINLDIAKEYCEEIYYKMNQKNYFAISFKNNGDGFEIRNKYFKGCLGKKEITIIEHKKECNHAVIFEGFFDFLSFLSMDFKIKKELGFIILNSVSLIDNLYFLNKKYNTIYSFLDNDIPGENAFLKLKSKFKNVNNMNFIYKNYNDLNTYLMDQKNKDTIRFFIENKEQENFKNMTIEEKEDLGLLMLMQQADRKDTVPKSEIMKILNSEIGTEEEFFKSLDE